MKLTRPQRRLFFSAAYAALWCALAAWMLMPASYVYRATATGAVTWGEGEWTFGLLKFLRIEYEGIDVAGSYVGPDPGQTWHWAPPALALTVLVLLFGATVCRSAYLVSMKKHRLVGQCDECGYDLTGLLSERCPECGTAVRPRAYAAHP